MWICTPDGKAYTERTFDNTRIEGIVGRSLKRDTRGHLYI